MKSVIIIYDIVYDVVHIVEMGCLVWRNLDHPCAGVNGSQTISQPRPNSSHHGLGDEVLFVSIFVHTSGIQVTAKTSFILMQCSWKQVLAVKTDKELVQLFLGSTFNVIEIFGFKICIFWSELVLQASLLFLNLTIDTIKYKYIV